jgi:hypothetical protein
MQVDRLEAVEQSIYVEVELAQIFSSFALAMYQKPECQAFWERAAKAHADHVAMLEIEKWRIVREDLDGARIVYDDKSLLKEFKRFDEIRGSIVHPVEFKSSVEIALRALQRAENFHADRIFLADFGIAEEMVQALDKTNTRQREVIESLAAAADPAGQVSSLDLAGLDAAREE